MVILSIAIKQVILWEFKMPWEEHLQEALEKRFTQYAVY